MNNPEEDDSICIGVTSHWSRGDLRCLGCCPACGYAAKPAVTFARGDDSGLMPDCWIIHRCAGCASFFLDPRPDRASLPAAYIDYLTHDVAETEQVFTSNAIQWELVRGYLEWRFGLHTKLRVAATGRWLFSILEPWRLKLDRYGRHLTRSLFPSAGRLLDLGCGAGDFLALAQAMGWQAMGCDPDEKVVAICQSRGFDVRHGGADSFMGGRNSFDVITLNQVIEHVIDPKDLLRQCFDLLRVGGMVWIGFPNPNAIGAKAFGATWAGLHPPYHLCLPTQDVLHGWLQDAGFERVRFLRRGAHASANWRRSAEIAEHLRARTPPRVVRELGRALTDAVSTLTPHWGEETVAIAWKPS